MAIKSQVITLNAGLPREVLICFAGDSWDDEYAKHDNKYFGISNEKIYFKIFTGSTEEITIPKEFKQKFDSKKISAVEIAKYTKRQSEVANDSINNIVCVLYNTDSEEQKLKKILHWITTFYVYKNTVDICLASIFYIASKPKQKSPPVTPFRNYEEYFDLIHPSFIYIDVIYERGNVVDKVCNEYISKVKELSNLEYTTYNPNTQSKKKSSKELINQTSIESFIQDYNSQSDDEYQNENCKYDILKKDLESQQIHNSMHGERNSLHRERNRVHNVWHK